MQDASGSAIMRAIERVNEGIERELLDSVVFAIGRPMSGLEAPGGVWTSRKSGKLHVPGLFRGSLYCALTRVCGVRLSAKCSSRIGLVLILYLFCSVSSIALNHADDGPWLLCWQEPWMSVSKFRVLL